ncbi:MAG: CoA-transferase [Myxococcales bacterium]|nr:CoA-transferase [Myxococcales bacterium]
MSELTRAESCIVAIADAFRGDGEIMVSPFGNIPAIGVRLAKLSFEPDLLITDGIASLIANVMPVGAEGPKPVVEGWMPFRTVFDTLWSGRRHVMMGASQIDRFGNQNFACIGPYEKPKAQLLGMRGAPGNTLSHTTSYWVPTHGLKVFVEKVDVVSGVGYDRAATLGPRAARFHEIRRVVTNLCVLDFQTPDHSMRLASVHPGVGVDEVVEKTGFVLTLPEEVPETRAPSGEELQLIREVIDPNHLAEKELLG